MTTMTNKNNIRRLLMTVLTALLLPMAAAAIAPTLSIEDFTINAGETKTMLIDLSNPDTEVTLVQFDLRLPAGLTIAEEQGDLVIDIAGRTTWQKHSLQANATGGITRFLLASNSNKVISGTSGAIISIQLTAANTFKEGDIKLEEQLIVTPSAAETYPADYIYKVSAPSSAIGTPPTLSIEDFTINAGETQTMLIDLSNPDTEVTLVQFDLRLPEGLTIDEEQGDLVIDIAGRTTWKNHSLLANDTGGITRFLLASGSNKVITGTSGAIISIQLTASNTFKGGDIKLEEQLIVTPSAAETYPADYTYKVSAGSTVRGDANGDGSISVTDIAVVVNCILQLPNTGSFSEYGADANGDGDITVTDIGVIVDKILGNTASSRKQQDLEPQ